MVSQEEILKELQKYPDGILLPELAEKMTYRNDADLKFKVRVLRKKKLVKIESTKNNGKGCYIVFPIMDN